MKRIILVTLLSLILVLSILGCDDIIAPLITPPIPPSEYPADITGDVVSAGFVQNYIENSHGKLEARRGFEFWVVNIYVKNKDYSQPISGYYEDWVIKGNNSTYRPPDKLIQLLRATNAKYSFDTCPTGKTKRMTGIFEVSVNLSVDNALISYQGTEPYSYGKLTGGDRVVGYDLLAKRVVDEKEVIEKTTNVAKVTNIWVGFLGRYSLNIELKPNKKARANIIYIVELYEKGKLRGFAKVRWTQPEINVSSTRLVQFPATRNEWNAYSSFSVTLKDMTNIFSVKTHEE